MSTIEASDAMHLVKEIPAEDARVLRMMANMHRVQVLDSNGAVDYERLRQLLEDAYRKGRETEAQRHRMFLVGTLEDVEKISIVRAMEYCSRDVVKAAQMLAISKTTMYRKIKQYALDYGQKKTGKAGSRD